MAADLLKAHSRNLNQLSYADRLDLLIDVMQDPIKSSVVLGQVLDEPARAAGHISSNIGIPSGRGEGTLCAGAPPVHGFWKQRLPVFLASAADGSPGSSTTTSCPSLSSWTPLRVANGSLPNSFELPCLLTLLTLCFAAVAGQW